MKRKLIIDGNAVYEIDEDCMLQKRIEDEKSGREADKEKKNVYHNARKDME